jgi:hypothetical protein
VPAGTDNHAVLRRGCQTGRTKRKETQIVSAERWLLVPCRAVPTLGGGWANDGATVYNYPSYEEAAEWMGTFPRGAAWKVQKRTGGTVEHFGTVVSQGDGTVAVEDAAA